MSTQGLWLLLGGTVFTDRSWLKHARLVQCTYKMLQLILMFILTHVYAITYIPKLWKWVYLLFLPQLLHEYLPFWILHKVMKYLLQNDIMSAKVKQLLCLGTTETQWSIMLNPVTTNVFVSLHGIDICIWMITEHLKHK